MRSYCLKYRKDTKNINPGFSNISNGKTFILSKRAISSGKKSNFVKNEEAKGRSHLGLKTTLRKVL